MPIYDGVVTLAEDDIPVVVELDNGHVRLSASGREIGQWRSDECEIVHLENSTYTINAENETLRFVPSQPSLFADAIVSGKPTPEVAPPSEPKDEPAGDGIAEAPPPRPLTVGLFYALCIVTGGMGVWALVQMIF